MPMRTGSNVSLMLQLLLHDLEDLAVRAPMARGQAPGDLVLVRLAVLARLADQGAQLLAVGGGMLLQPTLQRFVALDQVVAPLLGLVQRQALARRALVLGIQGFA